MFLVSGESAEFINEIAKSLRELNTEEIGGFLDEVYLKLDSSFERYRLVMNDAVFIAKKSLSSKEQEFFEKKIIQSNSKIDRPRSLHELNAKEFCYIIDLPKEEWPNLTRGIIRKIN